MLTRLSTPSPFPQTPARQTAPAAQRPAAQRQGFSEAQFKRGWQILTGLKDLELDPKMPKAQKESLYKTLRAECNDFATIAREFSLLDSDASYIKNKSKVVAKLSEDHPGLLGVFMAFDAECPAEGRSAFIKGRIKRAERLSKAFEELFYKHFPPIMY